MLAAAARPKSMILVPRKDGFPCWVRLPVRQPEIMVWTVDLRSGSSGGWPSWRRPVIASVPWADAWWRDHCLWSVGRVGWGCASPTGDLGAAEGRLAVMIVVSGAVAVLDAAARPQLVIMVRTAFGAGGSWS
ncbi:hypothetical protein GCM10009608_86220 [Pseudonocardia alaniniphila]